MVAKIYIIYNYIKIYINMEELVNISWLKLYRSFSFPNCIKLKQKTREARDKNRVIIVILKF